VWIEAGLNAVVSGMAERIPPTIQTLLVGYSLAEMNVYSIFQKRKVRGKTRNFTSSKKLMIQPFGLLYSGINFH